MMYDELDRPVSTGGGDFVRGDKNKYGDEVHGDKIEGDQIKTGNIEGVGIAVGTGASVRIYGDVYYYPIKLRAPLRKVFDPLIKNRTELFGGRRAALDSIGRFIQKSFGGFLMVTAPAGFGKTALMAALVSRTPEAFAYHFFTTLYGESSLSEVDFLRNVVEQMAEWHNHKELVPSDLQELRALYWRFIEEPLERTQILILDGLDEIQGWEIAPYLSLRLKENMHVILTVRDVGQDWMSEYGLPEAQTQVLHLSGLAEVDVAQVLRSAAKNAIQDANEPSYPPDKALALKTAAERALQLAGRDNFLIAVMNVAAYSENERLGADPFYIRWLAVDIARGTITAENIADQPKGLDAYLEKWWHEAWGLAIADPAKDLLGVLTVAFGPILRSDLEAIQPNLVDERILDYFDQVLIPIRRFVLGDDDQGYALAHPRLQNYMQQKIRVETYQNRLLTYCANWKENQSEYVLTHYAAHLAKDKQNEALYHLIDKPWMELKKQHFYSHRSFARDIDTLIQLAAEEQPPNLVQVGRGALIYATLGELATNLPPELLALLAQLGQEDQALDNAKLIQDLPKRCQAYLQIGEVFRKRGERARGIQIVRQALTAAETNQDVWVKAELLDHVAEKLAQLGDREGVQTRPGHDGKHTGCICPYGCIGPLSQRFS